MTKPSEKQLLKVDNNECILVSFINEKDDTDQEFINTGYLCWLESNDQENIANIIKNSTEVAIQWPNCDVKSAQAMSKMRNVVFTKFAVKVLAYGEWTDMKAKQNNVIQFGLLDPSREDRRNLKKKVYSDDECNESTSEPPKKKLKSTMHHDDDLLKELMTQKSKSEPGLTIADSSSSDDDNDDDDDNGEEIFTQMMQEKNEELDKMYEQIKSLKAQLSDLHGQLNTISDENEILKKDNDELKKINKKNNKVKDVMANTIRDFLRIQVIVQDRLTDLQLENAVSNTSTAQVYQSHVDDFGDLADVYKESQSRHPSRDGSANEGGEKQNRSLQKEKKIKKGFEPTAYQISEETTKNINKKDIKVFSSNIIDILFEPEELAKSSVTGIPSNANKDQICRPGLDKDKLAAARNLCYQYFHQKHKNWCTLFNGIASSKCSAARRK